METSHPSRRRLLTLGAIGLSIGSAGCSGTDEDGTDRSTGSSDASDEASPRETTASTTVSAADLPVENVETGEQFETIQPAIDNASAGETLRLRHGTHNQGHVIYVDKPLTIKGERGTVVTWAGGEDRATVPHTRRSIQPTVFYVQADDVTIENLVIDGQSTAWQRIDGAGVGENENNTHHGIRISNRNAGLSNVTVRDVTVRNTINWHISAFGIDGLRLENVTGRVTAPQSRVDESDCRILGHPKHSSDYQC